jgi:hypothetical protein
LIERFIKVPATPTGALPDVRSLINNDMKFEEVFSLSTVSQIRQMMNKHLSFEAQGLVSLQMSLPFFAPKDDREKRGAGSGSDHEHDHDADQNDEHHISVVPTLKMVPNKSIIGKSEAEKASKQTQD